MARAPVPLRRRLALLSTAVTAVFLALLGLLTSVTLQLREAVATAQNVIAPANLELQRLGQALVDQETGERGFLLTGDETFLQPYVAGISTEENAVTQLETLLAGRPRLLNELGAVERAAIVWRQQAAEPEIAAVRGSSDASTRTLAAALRARGLFDEARSRLDALQSTLRDELIAATARTDRAVRRLELALIAGAALVAVTLVAARLLFSRWVSEPVRTLRTQVQAVEVDRDHEVEVTGPPELVGLAAEVERMRARLAEQVEAAERANEGLTQQAGAVVALREQLAPALHVPTDLVLGARLEPAEGVLAGDWYDVVDLGGGRWAAVLVDIAGHGPAAGMLGLRLKTLLLPALRDHPDPADAVAWTAASLGDLDEGFATAVLVVGTEGSEHVRFVGAGHPSALLITPESSALLDPTGPLVCDVPLGGWTSTCVRLSPGSRLVMFTDGLPESRSPQEEEYGAGRLVASICRHTDDGASASELLDAVLTEVREWTRGRAKDDRTLLVLDRPAR